MSWRSLNPCHAASEPHNNGFEQFDPGPGMLKMLVAAREHCLLGFHRPRAAASSTLQRRFMGQAQGVCWHTARRVRGRLETEAVPEGR